MDSKSPRLRKEPSPEQLKEWQERGRSKPTNRIVISPLDPAIRQSFKEKVQASDLSKGTQAVLFHLIEYINTKQNRIFVFPRVITISTKLNQHPDTTRRHLRTLTQYGLIIPKPHFRLHRDGKQYQTSNTIWFSWGRLGEGWIKEIAAIRHRKLNLNLPPQTSLSKVVLALCATLPPLTTLEDWVRAVLLTSEWSISNKRVKHALDRLRPGGGLGCVGIIQRLVRSNELIPAGTTRNRSGGEVNLYSITPSFKPPEAWRGNDVLHHTDLIDRVKAVIEEDEDSPRSVRFLADKLGYSKSGPVRSVVMKLVRQGWLVPVGDRVEGTPRSYLRAQRTAPLLTVPQAQLLLVKSTSA